MMEMNVSDPVLWGIAALLVILIVLVLRRPKDPMADRMLTQVTGLSENIRALSDGQHQLQGGLKTVAEAQVEAQARMIQKMEQRLQEVQKDMTETLHGSAVRTTRSLTELQARLATIDKAQTNIEKLSGDVLSLQDILSNKQTRGAFGEIQLNDIVSKALPSDAYAFQVTLSNGKRADCLIHLPNPPGPIVIDSKFPLEAYEKLVNAGRGPDSQRALAEFRNSVRAHIRAIAERYVIEGETADGAILFLPSEAVYAELYANHQATVEKSHRAKVWIVSPTTLMATLNTIRAVLKDASMQEQAGVIQTEVRKMLIDVERIDERVGNLKKHFKQAEKDIGEIGISTNKVVSRGEKIEQIELGEGAEPDEIAATAEIHALERGNG